MSYLSVLLADDEALTRLDIKEFLMKEGHIIAAETGNGQEILRLATLTKPDIALLDIKMPGLDGIEAASQLRKIGIPSVLMTAYDQSGFLSRAQNVGVYGYINKPIRQKDVLVALQIAYRSWKEMQRLAQELDTYKNKLQDQKKISKAKGVYARDKGISEYDAHREILKIAMDKRISIIDICEEIIDKKYIDYSDK